MKWILKEREVSDERVCVTLKGSTVSAEAVHYTGVPLLSFILKGYTETVCYLRSLLRVTRTSFATSPLAVS